MNNQRLESNLSKTSEYLNNGREKRSTGTYRVLRDETVIVKAILFEGQVAGNVGCWEQEGERLVSYWLGREFWGRGIASAALSLLLREVNVRPLQAHVVKHNLASIRILQKCGFTISGAEKFPAADGAEVEEIILSLVEG